MTQRNNRLFVRLMLSNASESQLDKQGRISIPSNLLKIAKIEKDVLIIGTLILSGLFLLKTEYSFL